MNLTTNAIKFTPANGHVRVSLALAGDRVRLEVPDTGRGFDAAFQPHLFEPFRQADASTTRQHGGLGIGLSVVRPLVQLHGGEVTGHSDGVGLGATFRVELPVSPRMDSQSATDQTSGTATHRRSAPGPSLTAVRVLLVEDDRDLARRVLERSGANVTAVASAREAIERLDADEFDVLVSDIGLPDEDGLQLMRRIRRREPQQGGTIPAVALTAFARAEDRHQALAAGFQHFVSKPLEAIEFVNTVASLAGQSGSAMHEAE